MIRPILRRRRFLRSLSATAVLAPPALSFLRAAAAPAPDATAIRERIEAHRPSRLAKLPRDFRNRVGATHVAGKYHLSGKPFLVEGAEKLIALGTRLGKFWFEPRRAASNYPFNSQWPECKSLADLAGTEYFQTVFALPFATIMLEASSREEEGWRQPNLPSSFYENVSREYYELAAHLYRTFRGRALTFIIQHWEGDWLLRGRAGELWQKPPDDWPRRCEQMRRWLTARQAGVTKARQELGLGARCRVAHAAEVNRVADGWKNLPTVTRHVLPHVELDLVSYSAYDGMKDPIQLWKCIEEIRAHARTGSMFGPRAVYLGEMGIPENDQPNRVAERWDEFLGVFLAADLPYLAHWELYCNELNPKIAPPKLPITNPAHVRGFWLVKPDGSLSLSGQYFKSLWDRAG